MIQVASALMNAIRLKLQLIAQRRHSNPFGKQNSNSVFSQLELIHWDKTLTDTTNRIGIVAVNLGMI